MDVPEGQSASEDLPERHVTVNQLIALNMARFRKAAGLTQEQLGERLGWSNVAVSAAERSWDGKRLRQFDADTIIAMAMAIGVPVIGLFLPPEDHGVVVRYVLTLPGEPVPQEVEVGALLSCLLPAGTNDSPAMAAYSNRLIALGEPVARRAAIGEAMMAQLAELGRLAEYGDGPESLGAELVVRAWAKIEERTRENLIERLAEAEGVRLAIGDLRSFEREYRQKLRAAIQEEMSVLTAQLARLSPEDGS